MDMPESTSLPGMSMPDNLLLPRPDMVTPDYPFQTSLPAHKRRREDTYIHKSVSACRLTQVSQCTLGHSFHHIMTLPGGSPPTLVPEVGAVLQTRMKGRTRFRQPNQIEKHSCQPGQQPTLARSGCPRMSSVGQISLPGIYQSNAYARIRDISI